FLCCGKDNLEARAGRVGSHPPVDCRDPDTYPRPEQYSGPDSLCREQEPVFPPLPSLGTKQFPFGPAPAPPCPNRAGVPHRTAKDQYHPLQSTSAHRCFPPSPGENPDHL